jgi:hypothetical protein
VVKNRYRVYHSLILSSLFSLLIPRISHCIEEKGYTVEVQTLSESRLDITFTLVEYTIHEFLRGGDTFSRIEMGGTCLTGEWGKPEIPFVSVLFGIPVSGSYTLALKNIVTESRTIPLISPVDSILLRPQSTYRPHLDDIYSKDLVYPEIQYRTRDVGFFRDHRLASLQIYPFRYNPRRGDLQIIKKATFSITFNTQRQEEGGRIRIPKKNSVDEELYSRMVVNYETCKRWLRPHPLHTPPHPRQADTLYRIATADEGLHQITYTDLVNAGIDPSTINPREIHITHRGFEIPIYVKGEEDSTFHPQDYIDFFAERISGDLTYYNPYTTENVYWLSFGDSLGKRMVEEDGSPLDTTPFILPSFLDTLHFETDSFTIRLSHFTADSTDIWFWDRLYGPDSQKVQVHIPSPDTGEDFGLSLMLHGLTTTSAGHTVQVFWNGSYLGEFFWSGQKPYMISIDSIPGYFLINGNNEITLILPAPPDSVDGLFSNWIEVYYTHLLDADNNTISFKTPSSVMDTTLEFRLQNFDFGDVDIYKKNVSRIINFNTEVYQSNLDTKYRLIFQDRDITSTMRYSAVPIWDKKKPLRIEKVHTQDLHSPFNRAEYLIITHDSLRSSAEQYGLWKEGHGFDCMVVTVEDIYNAFNQGIASPEAIRDFIRYGYEYYSTPPLYCLLFGDGTYDYRGITGNYGNFVPVHLSFYWNVWGYIADDEFYARVSGDDYIPDIFIGRFPIRSNEGFNGLFEKIKTYVDYQNLDEWRRDLVFVADSGTAGYNSFVVMESIIAQYLPPVYDASRTYHPRKKREEFLKEMDEGTIFVNFLSHGGGDILCSGSFLISQDIFRMVNLDRMPFWTAFSCNNGFFDEPPDSHSIGETVFLAPNGGGIGYYGPGSNTYPHYNHPLSMYIYEGIFDQSLHVIGQFLSYSEIEYYATYLNKNPLQTYNLLGDPSIALTLPDTISVSLFLSPPSLSPGDTLSIQGSLNNNQQGEVALTIYSIQDTSVISFAKILTPVSSGSFSTSYPVPDTIPIGKGIVKAYFRGNSDGVGYEYFNIEQPNISGVKTLPPIPTRYDSVSVQARIFDPDSIIDSQLLWRLKGTIPWSRIPMSPFALDTFRTDTPIPPQQPNRTVEYRIYATDSTGYTDTSHIYSYHILARAELSFISDSLYLDGDTIVEINVDIQNTGETRADSFRVGFFTADTSKSQRNDRAVPAAGRDTITYDTLSLGVDSTVTASAPFDFPFDHYTVYAILDPDNWVEEEDESNNSSVNNPTSLWVDHFPVTPDSGTSGFVLTYDSVFYCSIPPLAVSSKSVLSLKPDSMRKPILQPDISPFPINGETTRTYDIELSFEVLIDSFTLSYALGDTVPSNPWVYLWLDEYSKWATVGITESDSIPFFSKRVVSQGLYSLFFNNDTVPPTITTRVENTNYSNQTVYERNVRISSVLSDENGIDVVTRKIVLVLNDDSVETSDYTYSKNPSDIRAIPMKFSKDLENGSYVLIVSAYDVNGNQAFDTLSFNVSIPFDIGGIGNYPNPVYLDSTIFTYTLSRDADEVRLEIYSSGGRLIKEFIDFSVQEGYHEVLWNLNDKKGVSVANGVYFYRFVAKRRGEEKIKTFKMAILR